MSLAFFAAMSIPTDQVKAMMADFVTSMKADMKENNKAITESVTANISATISTTIEAALKVQDEKIDKKLDDHMSLVNARIMALEEKVKEQNVTPKPDPWQVGRDVAAADAMVIDGDESTGSGPARQIGKKFKADGNVAWPSPAAASQRATSAHSRGPRVQVFGPAEGKKEELALCATGFKRKVPRALLEKVYNDIVDGFPPEVKEDASFWSYPFSKYFLIKFTMKIRFLKALEACKEQDPPFKWQDTIEDDIRTIFVRRNRPIAQVKLGRVNSHFHKGITAMLDDTEHSTKKLRFYNSELFIEIAGDIMSLLSLSESPGNLKYEVTPHYDHFKKLGFEPSVVDTMITTASAAARAE